METCLLQRYFDWICHVAMDGDEEEYQQLLHYLFEKDYRYTHPRDSNREAYGIDLRYRFGYLSGESAAAITCELDCKPCSVLEMMVALAISIEEGFLRDFDVGDRTSQWFKAMLDSLKINMKDDEFRYNDVDWAVEQFLKRNYYPNGSGGLFTLRRPPEDLRNVETWYQAMWWIDEQLNFK